MLLSNGRAILKINNSYARVQTRIRDLAGFDRVLESKDSGSPSVIGGFLNSLTIYVGSNDTPVTSGDYTFNEGNLGLTKVTSSGTNNSSEASYANNYIASFSATFRNDTNSDIIVKELGLIGNTNGQGYINLAMIARDVIDPITIAPGEVYTFTMYIG